MLLAVEPVHIPFIAQWINDGEVTYYMFYGQRPLNINQVNEEIQQQITSPNNTVFIIVEKSSEKLIGFAGLYDIHPSARKAELRILIGEKTVWNKGYGTEATELLTYYGFDRLNLNRIWLGVAELNKYAVRAYQKAGYQIEGRLFQDIYRNSIYYDNIRMAILREQYYPEIFKEHSRKFGYKSKGII